MQWGVALVGSLVTSLGLAAFANPNTHLRFARELSVGRRLYGALVFRFVAGVLLVVDAEGSRWPDALQILGWVMIVAAVGGRIAGLPNLRLITLWWTDRSPWTVRFWGLVAILLGGAILLAAV